MNATGTNSGRRHSRPVLAAALAGLLVTAAASHGGPPAPSTGARSVRAAATSTDVKISGWATFSGVNIAAGASPAGDAVPAPAAAAAGADLIYAAVVYRPELADLYIRWQVTKIPTIPGGVVNVVGSPTVLYGLRTTIAKIPVEIRVQSTGPSAIYQLYKCETERACTLAGNLVGAFGTTGEEVIAIASLATLASFGLPLKEGDKIGTPIAYTANSPSAAGAVDPSLYHDDIVTGKAATVTVPVKSVRVTVGRTTKTAALDKGYFSATFPRNHFPRNPTPVTTITCLGAACVTQRFDVRV